MDTQTPTTPTPDTCRNPLCECHWPSEAEQTLDAMLAEQTALREVWSL